MWPWEHVAFAYLLYSSYRRTRSGTRPEDGPVVALAFAALLPDLIDKPLAWSLGVVETGYAVAHSVFLVVPASIAAVLVARRYGHRRVGTAFVVGYWSHLVGDVIPYYLGSGELFVSHLLWPVVVVRGDPGVGLVWRTVAQFRPYAERLLAGDPVLLVHVALVVAMIALWIADGRPGPGLFWRAARRGRGA